MMLFMFFLFSLIIFLLDFLNFFFFILIFFFLTMYLNAGFFDGFFYSDFISLLMIFISVWVFTLSFFCMDFSISAVLIFTLMMFFILFSFLSSSSLFFYLSFEFVFVFMFYYLLNLGKSLERLQASFYMFFYTLFFSLPFLLMLIDYYYYYSSFFIFLSFSSCISFFWIFLFFVFSVKLPIFGFHVWLPKAHVEASVSGSMLLAGVLLKLGGYGIVRFFYLLNHLSFSNSFFLNFFFYTGLYGGLFISFLCFRQMDMKMVIAYSSVVHMSVMFVGLLSFSYLGLLGGLLMMTAHGFISPLMFFIMNKFYYYSNSRSVMVIKGLLSISSLSCVFWFLSCFLNLGVPPFMSFFSEIFIISSLSFMSLVEWSLIFLVCFFTGVYCVYLYTSMVHGVSIFYNNFHFFFIDSLICFLHLFYIIFYPLFFFFTCL